MGLVAAGGQAEGSSGLKAKLGERRLAQDGQPWGFADLGHVGLVSLGKALHTGFGEGPSAY